MTRQTASSSTRTRRAAPLAVAAGGGKTKRTATNAARAAATSTSKSSTKVAANAKTGARRQRLAPEVRAGLILDCAAKLIVEEGFTEISMERIGRDAGVSKALIYNYFPNLSDLLRALLEREINELREKGIAEINAADSFQDVIRRTTRTYIEHVYRRGSLLQRLWKESSVAKTLEEQDRRGHDETMRYFVKRVRKEYGLPLEVAIAAVDMQMAMTETAAQHLSNTNNNVDLATDICVHLLLGGLDSLAKAYQKK
jgi:AcrR family transcriptional regulator